MSLFGNGKMGWDSLGRSAGDCVNAGVGGNLDGAGTVDPGGVLPRDRLLVCDRDVGQHMTTLQTVILQCMIQRDHRSRDAGPMALIVQIDCSVSAPGVISRTLGTGPRPLLLL